MNYSIQNCESKDQWEDAVSQFQEANFLQSWNWGEFHLALHKKIFRLLCLDDSHQVVGFCLVVKEEARRGWYLTIAGGPLLDWKNKPLVEQLFSHLKQLAKEEKCLFIRYRPQAVESESLRQLLDELNHYEAPMHLTADLTLQLDLTQTPEELLSQMKKNTRYEVRKAEKTGITTRSSQDPEDIRWFHTFQLDLAQKHGFVPFSYEFWHEQFKAFLQDEQVELITAYDGETILASAFIIYYNNEAVYHYGISTPENQKLPGSYACQWASILAAQQRGCTRYNFWGIAPEDQANHRFAGTSHFKRGFGGTEVQYLPAHDVSVSNRYYVTNLFERFRKKLRRL